MLHLRSTSLAALLICVAVLTRPAASQDEDEERTIGPRVSTAALAAATALREGMPVAMDRFNGEVEV